VRLNGERGLLDVAEVRLAAFIERSGNTNENGVSFLEFGKIGGGAEMTAVDELLDFGLLDMLNVGLAGIQHGDFRGIGVKAGDLVASFGKTERQGKSYVTASDNSNF